MTDTELYWIDQYHEAMAALRKVSAERDALRARIEGAPKAYAYGGSSGDPMIACPDHLRHSTIALVEVND